MSAASRISLIALGVLAAVACGDGAKSPALCVGGLEAGQSLSVRLGTIYDAASDYWYDERLRDPSVDASTPSCAGVDGLDVAAVLTFVLREPLGFGDACMPWRADLRPESISAARLVVSNDIPALPAETIAASFAEGLLDGRPAFVKRGLLTPSSDFRSALVPRQRPPLVVNRELTPDNEWRGGRCYDAWIASWEGSPP